MKKKKTPKPVLKNHSVALPDDQWAWLLKESIKRDRSVSWLVRQMIAGEMEEKETA